MKNKKLLLGIILLILLVTSVAGCGKGKAYIEANYNTESENISSMFVLLEKGSSWFVVYHKNTKVMYVVSYGGYNSGNFTVMVDQNGKPLLYTEKE